MAGRKLTFDAVREIGRGMADVEESTMYGEPALKLRGRLVACMASHKSAEPGSLVVRTDFEERAALVEEQPETYYLTDHYLNHPVVLVRLSRIRKEQLRDFWGRPAASWRCTSGGRGACKDRMDGPQPEGCPTWPIRTRRPEPTAWPSRRGILRAGV